MSPLPEVLLRQQITAKNRTTLASLVRQLRSPLSVIPFVGAGMSAGIKVAGDPMRMPQWGELLMGLAAGRRIEHGVTELVDKGDFESAASLVDKDRPGILPLSVRDAFDTKVLSEYLTTGALSYLPFLASGPVITTNYDRVLEQVFEAAGSAFESVIFGPRPDETVAAIHSDSHVLVKMHGDCRDRTDQVFTAESYEAAYGAASATAEHQGRIGGLAWLLFTNRPLLFLGCSLEHDRTVRVLRAIRERLPGISHYAVLQVEKSQHDWEERERHLDAIGVRALWYFPRCYEEIESLLREALEQSSTTVLASMDRRPPPDPRPEQPVPMAAVRSQLRDKFPDLPECGYPAQLRLICEAIVSGRLTLFLGAYAGLDQSFLGAEFYNQLAFEFDCPPILAGDRTAVAAYVINRFGAASLWRSVREAFIKRAARPSVVHRFIAALPALLRERGPAAPLCIVTTNYDTLMEQALTEAGEPFQLLYYLNAGLRNEPCFLERSPGGDIRQIDKAASLRFRDASKHLLVKLNGGISYFGDMSEQASVERGQFERLAQRIPGILPGYLRRELDARSMLFLGHGLAEPDVGALVKEYADSRSDRGGSWAVQLAPVRAIERQSWNERARDWQRVGLALLDDDLEHFVTRMATRLSTTLENQVGPPSG
jgi:SIR2-like domain